MIIYAADDPLVVNGTYDREGYKPGERERLAKARARQQQLEKEATMAKRASKTDRKLTKPDKRPRQQDLIDDRAIKPLEDIAESYADVRDRRMELNKEEAELKQHALQLMHKYDKTIYRRNGVEIRIVPGEDDVKVRIKKPGEEPEAAESGEGVEIETSGESEAAEA